MAWNVTSTQGPKLQHSCNILAVILQRFLGVRKCRHCVKKVKTVAKLLQGCHKYIVLLFTHREQKWQS